jgi:hypothetical protein
MPEPGLKENTIPLETLGVLKQIATDCEETQQKVEAKFKRFKRGDSDPGVYFRFNLDQVPGDTQRWEAVGEAIVESTKKYIEIVDNARRVEGAATAIRRREPRVLLSEAAR